MILWLNEESNSLKSRCIRGVVREADEVCKRSHHHPREDSTKKTDSPVHLRAFLAQAFKDTVIKTILLAAGRLGN